VLCALERYKRCDPDAFGVQEYFLKDLQGFKKAKPLRALINVYSGINLKPRQKVPLSNTVMRDVKTVIARVPRVKEKIPEFCLLEI
jgi:hypothetical protein